MVQASSAIPFPSSPSRSVHASPSLSNQRDSTSNQVEFRQVFSSPTPTQTSSSSQQKAQQSPERPSQPHTPLTPPLTPASSASISGSGSGINSWENGGMSAFTTPARGPAAPPPTPASAGLLSASNTNSTNSHMPPPPSPVAVGTGANSICSSSSSSSSGNGLGVWPASLTSARLTRPLPHRLEVASSGSVGSGIGVIGSPRSEHSTDFDGSLSGEDRVAIDMRSNDSIARDGNSGGERYLLVGNVPVEASGDDLRDAFRHCGDVKGICLRFQESDGIVILAFYDSRHAIHAEHQITAQGQTYFGGSRLPAERMGAGALRKLMGDSEFINETEGEVLVKADGKIDAKSLQSIVSGFGELRAFIQANVANSQAYIAEYFDCRNAKNATDALNGRSIFGIRLCLVPKHAAKVDLLNRVSFPQNSENARQSRHGGSQPTSPLNSSNSFVRMPADSFSYSPCRQGQAGGDGDVDTTDTSNSSPFNGSRALPLISPTIHSHSNALHSGGGRRISTGSVGVMHSGTGLHQSTSEQDLRRRAVANNAGCMAAQDGWTGDHTRRTSDTFCFDALRRAAGDLAGTGPGGHIVLGPMGRPRARAISESSASARVVSPSDGFSTAGMDVGASDHASYDGPGTSDHSTSTGPSGYFHDEREGDSEHNAHTRIPTASDSSLGAPHTPSPGPVAFNMNVGAYYSGSPGPSMLGLPGLLAPSHHGAAQYYLGSPLGVPASPVGLRYGYAPVTAGYSPGGLSITTSGSASSLHSPSRVGHQVHGHGHLPSSARSALDVTRDPPTERNQVDLDRIAAGLDTRTTIMIKNIPNKLSDRDLVEFIGRVCPRKIDFLYLRMDFQNGCNVGYAFVNFIHVQDLLHFARTKLGVKWNMFSSEKVLQMSYANYQGKEALIEKFKNSCVMDEREAWRPKIFYSTGPQQGLLEPFPAPTHFRRKERSAQNRGALFVPSGHGHGYVHGGTGGAGESGERGMLGTPFRRPNQHPQNLGRQDRF